jgi:hypothetical protein
MPGMSIFSGEAEGFGVWADGSDIFIPGMFMSIFSGAVLVAGAAGRDEEGIFISILRIPALFRVGFRLLVLGLGLDFGLPLDLLPMFIPGMFCMSCCALTGKAATPNNRPAIAIAQNFERKLDLKLFMIPSQMVLRERQDSRIDCCSLLNSKLDLFFERRRALTASFKAETIEKG